MTNPVPQKHVLRLLTFGGLGLVRDDGLVTPRVRPPRLALLAALATAGDRGVSRERLMALFWPDSDEARGRHSLRQSLYVLRQEIGHDVIVSHEAALVLDGSLVQSDVAEFRASLARGDRASAVAIATKPFLDGFYLPNAPDFERWVEEERARFSAEVTEALVVLARDASAGGDRLDAVKWWRELAALDPLSGHVAAAYIQALAAQGDRAQALAFIRRHEALVRRELDAEPDEVIRRLEAKLRAEVVSDVAAAGPRADSPTEGEPPQPPAGHAVVSHPPPRAPNAHREAGGVRRRLWTATAVAALALVTTAALARQHGWLSASNAAPPSVAHARTGTASESPHAGSARGASFVRVTTSSPLALRLYEEGLRAYTRFDNEAAHQLMHAALEEDSTFAMAAHYETKLAIDPQGLFDGRTMGEVRARALRLAQRAPERERLTISAELLGESNEPLALTHAESLVTRHPDDSQALMILSRARASSGDWPGAVEVTERALALDSAEGGPRTPLEMNCRFCQDVAQLIEIHFWSDSLGAAERVAHRFRRLYPASHQAYYALAVSAARRGDSSAANAWYRRVSAIVPNRLFRLRLNLALENYEAVERDAREFLASSHSAEWQHGFWNFLIALRNQGRLAEALQLHRTGQLPGMSTPAVDRGYDGYNAALLAFDRGDARTAAGIFASSVREDSWPWSPGLTARHRVWHATLQGMALAAAGDTVGVRGLVDSVEAWGRASLYGRDRRLHHYLRGLLLTAAGRCDEATREYRLAIHSPTLGFTRVNYELGRCLVALARPREAVAVLQPALRGEVDASNLYVTRTDLHELLASAFDGAGMADSAAFHYRAVVKAWSRADPAFHARRAEAERWLARAAPAATRVGGDR